jgi:hypothetical protein
MKIKFKDQRFDTSEEIQTESQLLKTLPRKLPIMATMYGSL